MALDYGYTITIEKDGKVSPDGPHTNQWQKKDGGGAWTNIPGKTGETYTVEESDRSASIRLEQNFSGTKAYSNVLTVTSVAPGCPYPDPVEFPHIEPTSAENGDTITMTKKLEIPGISETNYRPTWYGIPSMSSLSTREVIQNGGFTLDVTDEWAQKYEGIIVNQTFKDADDLDPICIGFYADSNPVYVNYVPAKTFGTNKVLTGPTTVKVGEEVEYELTYDGDVVHYTAVPQFPSSYADFISETKVVGSYKFVIKFRSAGSGNVGCTLTSDESKTKDENPVTRRKTVTASSPAYTLGTVKLEGPTDVNTNELEEYTISWTGDAPEEDVTFVWITDGTIASPNELVSDVSWSSAGTHFVWAQVSYNGDTQMPMLDVNVTDGVLKPGTPHGGGYVAGIIIGNGEYNGISNDGMNDAGVKYYIIVAPKSGGQAGTSKKWKTEYTQDPEEAGGLRPPPIPEEDWLTILDRVYGRGPTERFADSKHQLFNWVMNSSDGPRKQRLGGYSDWYVPAYYELEICHAGLKPGTNHVPSSGTACCGAMGKNPHSYPPGPGYTTTYPPQTSDPKFQTGGSEAFSFLNDYKSSSQNGRGSTSSKEYLGRSFDRGDDRNTSKTSTTSLARVIRRVKVDP